MRGLARSPWLWAKDVIGKKVGISLNVEGPEYMTSPHEVSLVSTTIEVNCQYQLSRITKGFDGSVGIKGGEVIIGREAWVSWQVGR